MRVEIRTTPFDPWQELAAHQQQMDDMQGKHGAATVFVGTMRDFNAGEKVQGMFLEHYPGMTERHLETICKEAMQRWDLLDALIIHRAGAMQPGDPIVLVASWAAHRGPAFAASRYLIEELKSRAPFWKKERLAQESRWVTHNTPANSPTSLNK
ncbi:MAG TPA: molybdenum cofactor biosynthesis protein MoaE [Gammaproteobacteria bacterium]|nr:molybdenum cofactor biosynthesis protein MoaE [Gammaproteobacteria bacterium]